VSDSNKRIKVLIADDQRVVRDGLRMIVSLMTGVEVVGVAEDGAEAIERARELMPDVVLMDLRMPGVDGVAATGSIAASTKSRVVVLTTYADDESLFPALRAGAAGYLTKDASSEQIEQAIRAVYGGQTWLDPTVQQRLAASIASREGNVKPGASSASRVSSDGLTAREVEVLSLIGEGFSNQEICEHLVLSVATVKTHVNRIFAKTGVRDRAQAVRYAYSVGLARPVRDDLPQ
jgi:DNA-binding NarL/FixJ family response regulator